MDIPRVVSYCYISGKAHADWAIACLSEHSMKINFNFIPAKKAIFKGQKMTSFPEIKSCYTKQIKTYSFVQSILSPPRKISFKEPDELKTCHEWVQKPF